MKKRFLNLILILGVILSMFPIYTRADSYSEAENIVKNYLEKMSLKIVTINICIQTEQIIYLE